MSYSYIDNLSSDARARYTLKLSVIGLEECPYRLPSDLWKDDPTKWPEIEYADLYNYLINAPGVYNQESMKSFRSLEAHRYFRAGFVQTVTHVLTETGMYVFRAEVKPSQRMNDELHHPWVAADDTGRVHAAHCTCMAGLGESCSHVAAVLFKIEAAVRLGYTKLTCTDKPCEWNNFFTDKVTPAPIANINFYREEVISKVQTTGRKRRATSAMDHPSTEEKQAFLQSIVGLKSKPVGLSTFKETAHVFRVVREAPTVDKLPRLLRHMFNPDYINLCDSDLKNKCESILATVNVTAEENNYLEKSTVGQSNNITWHTQRHGRITASFAHRVLRTSQDTPSSYIFDEILQFKDQRNVNSEALTYGRDNEKKVFKACHELINRLHKNGVLSETGMRVHAVHAWLSASADGVVSCDCHGKGVIEIKCPWSARDKSVTQFMSDRNSYMFDGELSKCHPYYTQVQLQMAVYDVSTCDFVVMLKDAMLHQEILRDDEFLQINIPVLNTFWASHVLPQLLTRSLETQLKNHTVSKTDQNIYCYCKGKEDGRPMVGCDGASCVYKWVHLECIRPKRKTLPKGKWYCKACKKK